jgi:prepilin-type N-terminal cleavage/methylation domain-containing protein
MTLVELMVVVAVIAVIAAISMTVYLDIAKKSKLAADQGSVASMRSAVALYFGRHNGIFPQTLAEVYSLIGPAPVYNCSVTPDYDPDNGKITYTGTIADC